LEQKEANAWERKIRRLSNLKLIPKKIKNESADGYLPN